MPDPTTESQLRGLVLGATELKAMTDWPDALVEDYLNLLDNLITISRIVDAETDQNIEDVPTDFQDGSIPYVSNGFLVENNGRLFWDSANFILKITGIIQSRGRYKGTARLTVADSPYIVKRSDENIFADTDGGAITLNLPAGIDGEQHKITNTGLSNNDVTMAPDGTELLNGFNASEVIRDSETFDLGYGTTEGWWA